MYYCFVVNYFNNLLVEHDWSAPHNVRGDEWCKGCRFTHNVVIMYH